MRFVQFLFFRHALGWTYGTDRQRRGHPERTNATLESTFESSYGV